MNPSIPTLLVHKASKPVEQLWGRSLGEWSAVPDLPTSPLMKQPWAPRACAAPVPLRRAVGVPGGRSSLSFPQQEPLSGHPTPK